MLKARSSRISFPATLLMTALVGLASANMAAGQDWRADRGRTWRDDSSYRGTPPAQSAPKPAVGPATGNTLGSNPSLGYGLPGYSYSGPSYDRYVTDANRSTSTGNTTTTYSNDADPGLATCPQRTDTSKPSEQTYFGSDGQRHPCP